MTDLVIAKWNDEARWASEGSWNLDAFISRIKSCTDLRGTELKGLARGIKKQEILIVNNIVPEKAGPLIHILKFLGAMVVPAN